VLVGMRRLHGVFEWKQRKIRGLDGGRLIGGEETLKR